MPGNMTVSLRINADGSAAITSLKQVEGAVGSLGQKGKASSAGIESLTSSLKSLAITATAALTVERLAASFMSANMEASKFRAQLVTATGSVEQANRAWSALQGFAANTPYSLAEATQAFVTLRNRGLDASISAMTSYGNTSAALSKNVTQMAEAVADAVNGDFARAEEAFSVNAQQNGDKVIMTFKGVSTEINNTSADIQKYLQRIGNVDFAGGMERQGRTLAGVLSTLDDNWAQLMISLGDTGATSLIGAAITAVSDTLNDLAASVEQGLPVGNLGAQLAELEGATGGWAEAIAGIAPAWQAVGSELANLPSYVVSIRDGALAIEEQGTAWDAAKELILAVGQAMIELPDNLQKAVHIILGEIDILKANFKAGMDSLPVHAQSAWAYIQNIILTAWANIKIAVAEAIAWIAGRLASMATDMAGFFAKVPEALDVGGVAAASAAQMTGLAASLNSTKDAVAGLKIEKAALGESYKASTSQLQGELAAIEANRTAQVNATRDVIAAGIADVDAKNQRRQAQVALNQEFALAVKQEADLQKGAALTMGTEEGAAKIKAQLTEQVRKLYAEHGAGVKQHQALVAAQKILNDAEKAGIDVSKEKSAILKALREDEAKATGAKQAGAKASGEAAKAAKDYERDLDALVKQFLPARADAVKLAEATDLIAQAHAKGDLVGKDYTDMVKKVAEAYDTAKNEAQKLIDKYDTEGARARELAKDREGLTAILADGTLKVEGAQAAIDKLTEAEKKNNKEADVWGEMWKNAVKRIDDTFSGLWEDLVTGTRSTLDSLKEMMLKWLAEVSYQMLLKPIVVGITTSLLGGTAGATGATGAMGAASNLVGPSNITSLFSTAWSLGATFLEGVAAGFSSMLSGTAGTALSFAWAGATSGTASGMAAGLGVGSAYLLPLIAIAGFAISKFFEDQEPRYGAWSATVGNNPRGLEDWENGPDNYAKGGFGLTFGLSDNGSKNMDASEFKDTYQAFADITKMLENFFGKDLSAKIKAGLEKAAAENWTRDGVMRFAGNESVEAAFKGMIDMIADQAAITGEHLGVAFEYALGDLTGTAEEMANQVQIAMLTAAAYTLIADEWNSHMGEMMALTGDFGADIRILGGYVEAFSNDGENAAQTLARIAVEISALEYAATITTTAIEGLSGTALIQMAEDLADAFGNIDVASQALAFFGQNFQHAGELFAIQARAAQEQINRIWKDLDFGEAEQIIPATRDEFTALVKGLDLTTESGRELFAELLKLSPMFDTLFDSMDAFVEWLSPADKTKLALERITGVFEEMGIKLPNTRDELLKLYESGGLTIEQMAVLGAYLDELKLLFGDVGDNVVDLTEKLAAQRLNLLDLAEQLDPTPYGSHDRIMQAEQALRDAGYKGDIFDAKRIAEFIRAIAELEDAGGDAGAKLIKFAKDFEQVFGDIARIASEKVDLNIRLLTLMGKDEEVLALQRQREMDAIDESNRWILKRIYALEDEQRALEKRKDEERKRVEDEYQSRMDAILAEREALDEAHQAQMEALSKQRDAANEALSAANGLLNSIQSALNSIRGSQPVDEFSRIRAQRQMAAWAASGTLPEQEALDRALGTISRTSANDFASESAYRLSKQTDYANLLVLEGLAGDKVDWAEKTVESLDKQAEMLDDYYQQSLDALDKQSEMISDWRDAQLERIDKLVINSDDILTKLDWLNPGAATGPVMVGANNGGDFQALRDEIAGLRADLAAIGTAQVTPLKSIDERLRKFDNDGMPPSRDGEVLLRAA